MTTAFTEFADLAVLLPLSAAILIWLLAAHPVRGALCWLGAVAACTGGTAVLKLYFFACPIGSEVTSPSGHTSFSTLVYGALAAIIVAKTKSGWWRATAAAAGALSILALAASRLALGVHTFPEVMLGIFVGVTCLAVFIWHYSRLRPTDTPLRPLLVAVVLLAAVLHGQELHAEPLLHALGSYLRIGSFGCV